MKKFSALIAGAAVAATMATVPAASAVTVTIDNSTDPYTCTFRSLEASDIDALFEKFEKEGYPLTQFEKEQVVSEFRTQISFGETATKAQAEEALANYDAAAKEMQDTVTELRAEFEATPGGDPSDLFLLVPLEYMHQNIMPDMDDALQACIDAKPYTSQKKEDSNTDGQNDGGSSESDKGSSAVDEKTKNGLIAGGVIAAVLGIIAVALPQLKNILPPQIAALIP
ncbi:MAG: hypothetical protein Q4E01_07105 [Actinomycetaceae bacterium]|nr:hypothetical protein [Actinomycetaceae bacterium]